MDIQKKQKRRKKKMKRTTNENLEAVRKNYTLANKSSLISLAKTATLCLFENINMNKKTEIEPI